MSRIVRINNGNYTVKAQPNGSITLDTGVKTGEVIITGNLNVGGNLSIAGKFAINGDLQIGNNNSNVVNIISEITSDLVPYKSDTYNLGTPDKNWNEIFVNKIKNMVGKNIVIDPTDARVDITSPLDVGGDLTVSGTSNFKGNVVVNGHPYGTGPIVTNVLYVTTDGNDTNDGSALDSTRACRTISGAVRSPLYKTGTSIKVSPGRYLEDNPIRLKPYTSVIGSDLRTSSIEPINKTQDLFHVDSSTYIAQMQFINGRSGIIDPSIDRGAYAVAFPNDEIITIYKSPYVQNCTNQSGPWLIDGAMFVPNQTVQIPVAVGITTFVDGVSTITVNVTKNPGAIVPGMSINTAPQQQGFFSARTLLLANKSFVQEQILAFIEQTYPTFTYQREKCRRDVGIIIENILYDACFGGNSKSTEAGLAYFNGNVSLIPGEEAITVVALEYIKTLSQFIIANEVTTDLLSGAGKSPQQFNYAITGGAFAFSTIANNIDIIKNIITSGTSAAPTIYYSTGIEFGYVSAEILIQANRDFLKSEVSAFMNLAYPGVITFDESKCSRDVGIILDAVLDDVIFRTNYRSIMAGVAYTRSYTSRVTMSQKKKTIAGIVYARDLAIGLITNAPMIALITRNFKIITDTINNVGTYALPDPIWTAPINTSSDIMFSAAVLQKNKPFLIAEVIAWINKQTATNTAPFSTSYIYNESLCSRDTGYFIDAMTYDLLYSGNSQCANAADAYYVGSATERTQGAAAWRYLQSIISNIVKNILIIPTTGNNKISQDISLPAGSTTAGTILQALLSNVATIISGSPITVVWPLYVNGADYITYNTDKTTIKNSEATIQTNTIVYLNTYYNTKVKCERDVGLIVDCVSQDVLLNGNSRSVDAGLSYYSAESYVIADERVYTINALIHARDVINNIVQNIAVVPTLGNIETQVINTFFTNGQISLGTITRSFKIITDIITSGPAIAPKRYTGTALFSSTGISADDVQESTKVTSVTLVSGSTYSIGLSTPTVGIGSSSQLYFGNTTVYPFQDKDVPDEWAERKYDEWGSMGGMLIDGDQISEVSPVRSFVIDAFTQVNQGGRGVRATRRGYAQLVSVFTIFSSIAVQTDSGGILSITNSNANFGDYCMISKGYGPKEFSGTVYNPPLPLYTSGYYPQSGVVEIFVPDAAFRPHISLIMEVEPPIAYLNDQRLPGFLTGTITTPKVVADSLTISDIETTGMYVGQTIYVRDQFGSYNDAVSGQPYLLDGTIITDIGPSTVYLNKPVNKGADYTGTNSTFFTIFTCGNAYYTVLTSVKAPLPVPEGQMVFPVSEKPAELAAINYIRSIMPNIISNIIITPLQTEVAQVTNSVNFTGSLSAARVDTLAAVVYNIVNNGQSAAPTIIKKGTVSKSNADAASLIEQNLNFIVAEVKAFMSINYPMLDYYVNKCLRDARLISFKIAEDLLAGGNYNAIYSGLSYFSRADTYHLVTLEDNVRDPSLFPDGITVNFYQRSYMSASGYLFEYVGAGSNYGALPQVGRVDPIQSREVNMLSGGKVFFTSTDQNGDFRIGQGLVINQASGVLSGRTFQKSLFAEMTPFILALEG